MICNELYNGQGLGNQLWNYVLTRIISKQKNCDFSIIGRNKFKGKEFMNIDFGVKLCGGVTPEGGPPLKLPRGIKNYYKEKKENLPNTNIDVSRTDKNLFEIPLGTKFDGNCQSTKYLNGYREDILNWIKINNEYKKYTTDNNTCVIHLRCGDFTNLKDVFLPISYYKNAIKYIKSVNNNIKFYCVTDQKKIAEKLLPDIEIIGSSMSNEKDTDKAPHHKGGPVGIDFSFLMNARYLIIPNSSFSWWAAYMNTNKKIVVAPKYWARYNVSDGYWSTSDIITDDFIYLDRQGKVFTSNECWKEKNNYELANKKMFTLKNKNFPVKKILGKIKEKIKKSLNLFNDTLIYTNNRLFQNKILEYRKTIKIYDIFTFFNELDLLEIRLNILDKYVDYFVIIEATETFSGKPKRLYYEENKHLFKKFEHKIIHYIIDDTPKDENDLKERLKQENISDLDWEIINNNLTSSNVPKGQIHWLKEFYQKESIKKPLEGLADDDICFVSDLDEIWNPKVKIDYSKNDIFKLRQKAYSYYLNNRSDEQWAGTLVTKYKNIKNNCLNHLRTAKKTKYTYIKNGGWHFTNMGGVEQIKKKLESYGHQEFNNEEIKSKLEEKILNNQDFIGRKFKFWTSEKNLPKYLLDNKIKYKKLFK